MASRNRVIYQSESLFVSDNVGSLSESEHEELIRVQSANYGFTINRTDVNQFGNLARIDSLVLEPPTVNFDFSYYLSNGKNESSLGFSTDPTSQFVSGFLEASSGKNFYIVTSDEGQDSTTFENGDSYGVIGIGNAFLSDYTVDLSVGSLPTTSVTFEASNINSQNGLINSLQLTGDLPSVNPEDGTIVGGVATLSVPQNTGQDGPTALRPGDVVLSFPGFDGGSAESGALSTIVGAGGFHVQSASLSIPLSRSPISKLGSKFPYARVVDFPVNATMSVNAVLNTLEAGNLAKNIAGCGGDSNKEVAITLNSCEGDPVMNWTLKGATLDSESWSSSIGSNKSVDLTFGVQIGGIDDIDQGIIFSGAYESLIAQTIIYNDLDQQVTGFVGDIPDSYWSDEGSPVDWQSLEIGSSLVNIGANAFAGNVNLSGALTIPSNVRNIGFAAFDQSTFNSLVIEAGTTGIGGYAFRQKNGSENISGYISVPRSVKDIGNNAFERLGRLGDTNLYIDAENLGASSFAANGALSVELGTNVRNIEGYAFNLSANLSNLTINEGITGIGERAFQNCFYLTGIDLPDSLLEMDILTFAKGENDPNNVKRISLGTGLKSIPQGCFAYCVDSLEEDVVIPDNIESIGDNAFYDNRGPGVDVNFNFGTGVTGIGTNAFYRSVFAGAGSGPPELQLPPNIKSIGSYAFANWAQHEEVDIPSGVTSIGDNAFYNNDSITGVTINCPTGSWVGTNAFISTPAATYTITGTYYQDYTGSSWSGDQGIAAGSEIICYGDGCPVAETPTIAYDTDNVEISGIVGNVPNDWNDAFAPGDDIHYLTIGSSTEVIGDSAFRNEPTLSGQLTIPATVRNIKDYAFEQPRFTGIVIEEGITGIGQFAFYKSAAPYTISGDLSIPDSVIDLGLNSFYGLQEVDNVYVGARNIGAGALSYGKFTGVTLGTGVETIGQGAFEVGDASNSFITSVNNTSTVLKDIGAYAFRFHYGITSFNFNEGLTGIGQLAFDGADSPVMELTGIILPDSVTNIGDYSFNDCKKVRKLRIGSGVTSIGQGAFGELGNAAAVPNIEVEINCPTGSFGQFTYSNKAFAGSKPGIYTITGTYYQDYTGTLTRDGIGIPAGSTFISGTY